MRRAKCGSPVQGGGRTQRPHAPAGAAYIVSTMSSMKRWRSPFIEVIGSDFFRMIGDGKIKIDSFAMKGPFTSGQEPDRRPRSMAGGHARPAAGEGSPPPPTRPA